ncbi:MAG: ZIP family metal transporter [Actinobacteria bacterium]|nr:ZIP family metal transporter [Actinomycetota bacterium]MBW3646653.1 ZIP family metal transporter [Actinomycetota bacterium]
MPLWTLVCAALAALAVAMGALALLAGNALPSRNGPPVEELAVERTVLLPGVIDLTVRNTGPDPVQIAQVFVNDSFVDVVGGTEPVGRLDAATLRLNYPWQEGQPYLISMLTATGVVVEHEIPAAVRTPDGVRTLGSMALLGVYVGIIPVALGMMALPLLRRAGPSVVRVLLALTVGLLAYLAIDGGLEAIELAELSGGAFGGPSLVVLGAGLAFLLLTAVDRAIRSRRDYAEAAGVNGRRLATTIAVGIGLHNLGEGLAIGSAYAVGELALGAFLVVGFALHNTTEGIAIVAPLTRQRPSKARLAVLALLAGAPASAGAVIGAAVNNSEISALLLGVGVGAIVQVIVQIAPTLRSRVGQALDTATIGGITAGLLLMYLTGLLVTV